MRERRRRLQNRILRTLPGTEYRRLTARSRVVHVSPGGVLHAAEQLNEYVYFPMTGVCGMVLVSSDGERCHVGSIGCEGVTGAYRQLACSPDIVVDAELPPSIALQVPSGDFEREMDQRLTLRSVVREFYAAFNCELMLSVVCNRRHSLRQRYCRHLLALADRVGSDELQLTQTVMAAILGTTRPSVTLISLELKRIGALAYNRSVLTILDRKHIESLACACYATVHQRLERLLPPPR